MKKKYCLLFCLVMSLNFSFAQTVINIPNNLKEGNRRVKNAFTVVNAETKGITLFIDDHKTLNAYVLDKNLKRTDELSSEGLPNRYDEVIGNIQQENKIMLFLKNRSSKKFGSVVYDFKTHQTKEIKYDFKLRDERFLEALSKNNKFYIVSVSKDSSTLNFCVFEGTTFTKKSVIFSEDFRGAGYKPKNLDEMLTVAGEGVELMKIENQLPISMEMASSVNKFYETEDGFDITLDKSIFETYVLSVNLSDFSTAIKRFEKAKYTQRQDYYSNSFLLEDNIYQVVANSDELYFDVKNRATDSVVKSLRLERDQDINFKNTPIIQDKKGDLYAPHRELEKTSKFLRKIANKNIGLAVRKVASGYQITMGSYIEIKGNNAAMMGMPGGMGMMGSMTGFGFPMGSNMNFMVSYYSYTHGKSVRIECLFDKNLDHLTGEPKKNAFDKINEFTEFLHDPKAETVFKWNDEVYYGYYFEDADSYQLLKFSEES